MLLNIIFRKKNPNFILKNKMLGLEIVESEILLLGMKNNIFSISVLLFSIQKAINELKTYTIQDLSKNALKILLYRKSLNFYKRNDRNQ